MFALSTSPSSLMIRQLLKIGKSWPRTSSGDVDGVQPARPLPVQQLPHPLHQQRLVRPRVLPEVRDRLRDQHVEPVQALGLVALHVVVCLLEDGGGRQRSEAACCAAAGAAAGRALLVLRLLLLLLGVGAMAGAPGFGEGPWCGVEG